MPDKSKQLQEYLDAVSIFLNSPAAMQAFQNTPVAIDIRGLFSDLYTLCDAHGFTVKDEEWLRSIGISLG